MGFTYAVQVQTGKEIKVKELIELFLKRFGNPGIVSVNALENFTVSFKNGEMRKKVKAKVAGYIFITVDNTDGNLGMAAHIWQFIKKIKDMTGLIVNILRHYIETAELDSFFEVIDEIEPEVEIVASDVTEEDIEDEISRSKQRPLVSLAKVAAEYLSKKKTQKAQNTTKMLSKIHGRIRGQKSVYNIPFSLYNMVKERMGPDEEKRWLDEPDNLISCIKEMIQGLIPWKKR